MNQQPERDKAVIGEVIDADDQFAALRRIKAEMEFPCAICGASFGAHNMEIMVKCFQSFATAISEARAEEQRNFINNVAAVLDADDVELFTALIMKAKQSPDLNSATRSALKSEPEIRADAWKEAAAIATLMAAGETNGTGRQKALNIAAALESAKEGVK